MYAWIRALTDEERDVGRPPEFFGDGVEWTDELEAMQDRAAGGFPPFEHLTPPEVFVLSYMDDETAGALVDVLDGSEDPAARRFLGEVGELAGGEGG